MNDAQTPGHEAELLLDLERLVEGELDRGRLPDLVRRMDQSPKQWRNLGMLLIEQQQFRRAVRAAVAVPEQEKTLAPENRPQFAAPATHSAARRSGGKRLIAQIGLIAATLLIGLALGASWRGDDTRRIADGGSLFDRGDGGTANREGGDLDRQGVGSGQPGEHTSANQGPIDHGSSGNSTNDDAATHNASTDATAGRGGSQPASQPIVGMARWHDGESAVRSFPVLPAEGLTEQQLMRQRPIVSAVDRQALIRKGWRVEFDRKVMSVQLADGKRLMIPVDIVNYRPVGRMIN